MPIYTRKGDEGFTNLLGGVRARKDDSRLEAIGLVDELNCLVGWALAQAKQVEHVFITSCLEPVQDELFVLGARLAALGTPNPPRELDQSTIDRMERDIDTVWEDLGSLQHFVLPRGCELACRLHVTRAACRRAERAVVHLLNPTDAVLLYDPQALRYLNRLSDELFALARLANRDAGGSDQPWSGNRR